MCKALHTFSIFNAHSLRRLKKGIAELLEAKCFVSFFLREHFFPEGHSVFPGWRGALSFLPGEGALFPLAKELHHVVLCVGCLCVSEGFLMIIARQQKLFGLWTVELSCQEPCETVERHVMGS